ncbi:MAG: Na+/H+ antiporter NhaA [Bifidobacteriaceae bacterium]|jgi:NhaA family Na+:H+ antiporter|nr:Na+/H+ antiporter NhaA [Bifidobacteriaceae bacterium]
MAEQTTPAAPVRQRRHGTIAGVLRRENTGGILLAITALLALVWVNSPVGGSYLALRDFAFGPESIHLHLTVEQWAADGLLTVFFFLVGVELKREFTVGELASLRSAALPVVAAIGGMTAPALIYLAFNVISTHGVTRGWAVPVATDIAFSVAIMGLASGAVPRSLRVFLLTLAVADDLLGIVVIALFYNTGGLRLAWLAGCVTAVAAFGLLMRRRGVHPVILVTIAILAWYCMHNSGIHATIAGVLMGFTVPARPRKGETESVGERIAFTCTPVTYGVIVPLFALMTAGVSFTPSSIAHAVADPVWQGVAVGLVVGKPLGILAATWLMVTFTACTIDSRLSYLDILAMGSVAGIGFTVSLLINELAFAGDPARGDHGTMGVLTGSLTAALLGTGLMAWRGAVHKRRAILNVSDDAGIPGNVAPAAADADTPTGTVHAHELDNRDPR